MKNIYTVRTQKGDVIYTGYMSGAMEFLGMSSHEVSTVVKATEMGITITAEKEKIKPKPVGVKKIERLSDEIKSRILIYDNTVLGDVPEYQVIEALDELSQQGIVLEAIYNRSAKGWLIQRKR